MPARTMALRHSASHLLPLPVAAAIAYPRLVGDPMEERDTSMLEDRLERIALALSAVASVYTADPNGSGIHVADIGSPTDGLLMREADLAAAIETLLRAGVAFRT
jgi:hypothetical protein